MAPPNAPGIPGTKLPAPAPEPPRKPTRRGMPAPERETRPPMSNPPPEDEPPMQRPRSRQQSHRDVSFAVEAEGRPSVVDFQHEVRAGYGKASFAGPAWVFLALLVLGLLGVVIYLIVTRQAPSDCASSGDMNAAQKSISELTATVNKLTTTVGANADEANNKNAELRSTVTRNADRTERSIERLNDKIDVFIRR